MTLIEKFNRLNAEQKKKVVLVALLSVMGLYAVFAFVVTPLVQAHRRRANELAAIQDKLERADRALNREDHMRTELLTVTEELKLAAAQHIPPVNNPLSWVAKRVYRSARRVGVDIESVADLGTAHVPWERHEAIQRAFVPYRVRIVTQCGFNELLRLVEALETDNPFLSVSEMSIVAQENDLERHRVRFTVEWPYWGDPAEAEELTRVKEGPYG